MTLKVTPKVTLKSVEGYRQEVIGENVGSQDQVNAAYGGFNRISFLQEVLLFNKEFRDSDLDQQLLQEIEAGLLENKISFIYSPYPMPSFEEVEGVNKIYQDQGISIYQVRQN